MPTKINVFLTERIAPEFRLGTLSQSKASRGAADLSSTEDAGSSNISEFRESQGKDSRLDPARALEGGMGTLVIKNVDEALMSDLASLAAENQMQVESQVRQILRRAVPVRDRHVLAARLDAIADMMPTGISRTDSLELLREDRQR